MQGDDSSIYSILLQWAKDPAVLSALGGLITMIGTLINRWVIRTAKALWAWIVSIFKRGYKTHPLTEEYAQGGLTINNILSTLREKLNCARVTIIQFHNGHRFSLSDPVFKLSSTFESVSAGFTTTSSVLREIMVAPFINIVAPCILTNNPVSVPGVYEVDKCTKDNKFDSCQKSVLPLRILKINREELAFCAFRTLMENLGIEAAYAVLLTSPEGGPIGIMLLQFHLLEGSKEKVQEATCTICGTKHTLQHLLYVPA